MISKGRDNKPHIGIFGRRNSGKSSLINALTGQEIAIVSDVAGTTTDPVKKSVEIDGVGPVILIDTAGIDDTGELGEKRIKKTKESLKIIDLAILVITHNHFGSEEQKLIEDFQSYDIPFLIVHNKTDEQALDPGTVSVISGKYDVPVIPFSARYEPDPAPLNNAIREHMPETAYRKTTLVGDLISKGDVVLLITPIDLEAPEGRMILPQVQVIRDVLDHDGVVTAVKESEAPEYIRVMSPKPVLVITDSQVFSKADKAVPPEIPLTSFSITLARMKGDFENYLKGTPKISELQDGDRVLILESCTHHVTCDDIGRVKIPRWLINFTGKKLEFDVVAGLNYIERDIHDYALLIQCGGCMITRKQLINRLKPAIDAGIPVTNYGMAIAWMHGIFQRAVRPFTERS
ncbi:MAG TPA: [FeFe] hydrogenase H-cluster maturation GTPase HydF [Bacteroidales bacterium]|nr:[FeFe] hydrogenase H-cluster maturation GTPase HydF [Bacteroidales bacterium]HPS73656.1 [FeFe] hydrogenase H-cluster maturation GTPase HydF [Bacteroidales bacterium]